MLYCWLPVNIDMQLLGNDMLLIPLSNGDTVAC